MPLRLPVHDVRIMSREPCVTGSRVDYGTAVWYKGALRCLRRRSAGMGCRLVWCGTPDSALLVKFKLFSWLNPPLPVLFILSV